MKRLILFLIQIAICSGVVAGKWFSVTEAGNLAFAAIWIIALMTLVAMFADNEKFKNKDEKRVGKTLFRTMFAVTIVVLFAAGWFFTGILYLLSWFALLVKKQLAVTEVAKSA